MEQTALSVDIFRLAEIDRVDGQIVTRLFGGMGYSGWGLLICDMVRHVALMHHVEEDAVWEWVDRERRHPTTDIQPLQ